MMNKKEFEKVLEERDWERKLKKHDFFTDIYNIIGWTFWGISLLICIDVFTTSEVLTLAEVGVLFASVLISFLIGVTFWNKSGISKDRKELETIKRELKEIKEMIK
jgi:hypothetical protein